MKKFILLCLIGMFSILHTSAYGKAQLVNEISKYTSILEERVGPKLESFSQDQLKKLLPTIDAAIFRYNNARNINDATKLQKVAIFYAFKNIVEAQIEDDFSEIDSMLDSVVSSEEEIIIISDKRCGSQCDTTQLLTQLKQMPALKGADFREMDFSLQESKDILATTGITKLPAALFTGNDYGKTDIEAFLSKVNGGYYSLELGARYDPYIERSDKGFLILDSDILEKVTESAYYMGDKNAEILWIEYTDINCHYCKKMMRDGTAETVLNKYPESLRKTAYSFIGVGGQKTQIGAQVLECVGQIGGAESFHSVLKNVLSNDNIERQDIIDYAAEQGIDAEELGKCSNLQETRDVVASKFSTGRDIFGITGTPGNVLLNTQTGEYEIISGAYPASEFERVIESLLR